MKIGIISDTHDNLANIKKFVEIFNERKVELVIHAGDFVSPFVFKLFKNLNCKMKGVFGNNDGDKLTLRKMGKDIAEITDYVNKFEIDGKSFVVTHYQHIIDSLAKDDSLDFIIYGHTHKIDIREGKPMVINPGTASGYVVDKVSAVVLDTNTKEYDLIEL